MTSRHGFVPVLTVAVLLALAACGGAANGTATATPVLTPTVAPTPTPEPTPPPTPTPEPTLDIDALGAAYVAAGATLANIARPLLKQLDSGTLTDAEVSTAAGQIADAYKTAALTYGGLTYPPAVQADVAQLVDVLMQVEALFRAQVSDPTVDNVDAFNALTDQVPVIGARIRAALGLPPPPTAPPG
jgi:hypothetical protein